MSKSRKSIVRRQLICRPEKRRPGRSLEQIVDRYICDYRPDAAREIAFYAGQPSLRHAIELAALSITEEGKRHPHQRRIPSAVLSEARDRLLRVRLDGCSSFDALHTCITDEIGDIRGIGELTIYDISTRIGAHLSLEPEYVYLHAGTRAGARALGINASDRLDAASLPSPFSRLRPREIEDCLCIYKNSLRPAAA
jgi:hypothetical protein